MTQAAHFDDLDLPVSTLTVNVALQALIDHLSETVDSSGRKVFKMAEFGFDYADKAISGDSDPALFIWSDGGYAEALAVQMYTRSYVADVEVYAVVHSFNVGRDLSLRLQAFTDLILKRLQHPDDHVTGTDGIAWGAVSNEDGTFTDTDAPKWRFENPQDVRVDIGTTNRKMFGTRQLEPGWYVISIACQIRCDNR